MPILEKIHEKGEYYPTIKDVRKWFGILNESVFDGVIPKFRYVDIKKISGQFAACVPMGWKNSDLDRFSNLQIDEYFKSFKAFIVILAHEMIHNWQWVVEGKMTHGPSFFQWKPKMKEQGIPLQIKYVRENVIDIPFEN